MWSISAPRRRTFFNDENRRQRHHKRHCDACSAGQAQDMDCLDEARQTPRKRHRPGSAAQILMGTLPNGRNKGQVARVATLAHASDPQSHFP